MRERLNRKRVNLNLIVFIASHTHTRNKVEASEAATPHEAHSAPPTVAVASVAATAALSPLVSAGFADDGPDADFGCMQHDRIVKFKFNLFICAC